MRVKCVGIKTTLHEYYTRERSVTHSAMNGKQNTKVYFNVQVELLWLLLRANVVWCVRRRTDTNSKDHWYYWNTV